MLQFVIESSLTTDVNGATSKVMEGQMRRSLIIAAIAALLAGCAAEAASKHQNHGKGGGMASTGRPAWGSTITQP